MTNIEKAQAFQLDRDDVLAHFRQEFYVQSNTIYLDGNSLGLLSKRAEQSVYDLLNSWKKLGIDGWTEGKHPWFTLSEQLGKQVASLVGAKEGEVVVTGSTTINLHQLIATFYRPNGKKTKIVADELNFPSDIYALKSQLLLHGLDPQEHLIRVKSDNGVTLQEDAIIKAMTDEVALVLLPTVLYRSGQLLNVKKITQAAHDRGIVIGWDACHSAGSVPHQFHEDRVDFAFWCNYKYLNGGPGSVASLFVHERHHGTTPGLAGWFSSEKSKQFDMSHDLTASSDAGAFQIGTPHILSLAPLLGSFAILEEAGMERIRKKSLRLTQFLMDLVKQELNEFGFRTLNPTKDEERGGHVALEHPEAIRICKALKASGIVPDYRAPNVVRLAPVALYTSFEDVWQAVQCLKEIMIEKQYEQFEGERGVVA